MSSKLEALQSGLEALKKEQYQESINLLEKFLKCQVNPQACFKEFIQAQMGLVKAYTVTGQREKAITLCHQLAASQNTQVQAWAKQALISLSSESVAAQAPTQDKVETRKHSLTPEEAAELLKKPNKALRFKRFAEAVQAYEEFIKCSDKNSKDYEAAQTWLVKAYKGNEQIEEAVTLCKQLTNSQIESTLIWAQQYLCNVLNVSVVPEVVADSTDDNQSTLKEAPIPQKMRIPSLEEFKQFCQQHLLEDLQDLETSRKQTLNSIILVGTLILFVFGFLVYLCPINFIIYCIVVHKEPPYLLVFLFVMGFLGCIWGWIAFYTSATETYASGFKSKVIHKIFDFINTSQSLKYSSSSLYAETEQAQYAFNHSQIFSSLLKPNRITQNDSIYGRVGEVSISFSNIFAEVEIIHTWAKYFNAAEQMRVLSSWLPRFITRRIFIFMLPLYVVVSLFKLVKAAPFLTGRMLQGRKIEYKSFEEEVLKNEVTRKPVFRGLFFHANFNKTFKSKTVVIPHLANASIHALKVSKQKQVKLEDPEFTKLFIVYGDDQVDARYILSTNLMSKIVSFRKKASRNIYISFVDNVIYLAIEYVEDLFEPRLYQKMLSFTPLREYFEAIQLMLGIVEELNLDRKIWSTNE